MALFTGTQQQYYEGSDHGNYQFINLKDLVNNFIVNYVGENKIISKIKRTDVAYHVRRCMQEYTYDIFKSEKSQEIEVPPNLQMTLPHDYVNYVKLTWLDSSGIERIIYPTRNTSNPLPLVQDSDYNYTFDNNGNIITANESETWKKFKGRQEDSQDDLNSLENEGGITQILGGRYGIEPEYAQSNGVFFIDPLKSKIFFDASLASKIVTLKYISDGVATDDDMIVHKFAEEAIYKYVALSILSARANIPEYIINRFKKEKFASARKAKLRLSNLKIEELTQIMRGKSKHLKH